MPGKNHTSIKTIFIRFIPALLWALLIFFFSHQAAATSDTQSGFFLQLVAPLAPYLDEDLLITVIRKSAHFFLYFILGALMFWALHPAVRSQKRRVLISVLIVAGYAALDEFHQSFIPGRSAEVRDVLIDTVGGLAGILTLLTLSLIWQKHNHHTIIKRTLNRTATSRVRKNTFSP